MRALLDVRVYRVLIGACRLIRCPFYLLFHLFRPQSLSVQQGPGFYHFGPFLLALTMSDPAV